MFIADENMLLVTHNSHDCGDSHKDEYNTLNASNVEGTAFRAPYSTNKQATSTSLAEKKERVEQDKVAAWCRYLEVKWDLDSVDLDKFWLTRNQEDIKIF